MKKRLSVLLSLVVLTALLLSGCGAGKSEADSNVFRVGMEAGYPPFNWTQNDDSNGAVKIEGSAEYAGGYDVEIAKKIADSLGKKLVIVKTEWDGLVPALTSGKIDAIIAGMSPTEERKQTIDFSDNYYKSQLVLVVKNGGQYANAKTLADFNGAKVTAQLNTFHYSVIDQIQNVKKQEAMDNFSAMRVALESGVIDAYVSEKPEAVSAQSANPNFKMIELQDGFQTNPEDTQTAVGLKKDSDLTAKVNDVLSKISSDEQTKIMGDAVKNQPAAQ